MNFRRAKWVLLLAGTLGLILVTLKPLPPPKARAQRIHSVNHVANITITLPGTNRLPVTTPGK